MSDPQPDNRRYEQAKAILQGVLDVAAGARGAYLDAACQNDPELRAEVASLLAAYEEANSSFLASPLSTEAEEALAGPEDLDLTGRRVGAYRVERLLGRGGMGAVYLASRDDGEFTKHVAVKFIRPSRVTPALLRRFRAERQILADIDHPNIARLIDGGTADGGMPFFIMEYVQGETLAQALKRGPLPPDRAIQFALGVADVLEAIHAKGLVFRDLKPSNIMLTPESGVKVLDFGIAKIMGGAGDDESTTLTLTRPGWIVGSPQYMSPEQATGDRVNARSDIFSFGLVLFEALSGRLPFEGDTRKDYFKNLIAAKPAPLPPTVSARLRAVVERCLRKSPAERYASGKELSESLRALAGRSSSRAVWTAVALMLLAAVGYAVWSSGRQTAADPALTKGPAQPVATWASNETDPRISPDLKWLSFISDRDGTAKIWLIDRSTADEQSITPPGGDVRSHVWAPSADRIAYVAPLGLQTSLIVTPLAGSKSRVFDLPQADAVLVRWIGNGIYYLADGSLWRFDLASERPLEVTTGRGPLRLRSADVSADESHIVFAALKDTISSIWYAAIDGSQAVRLTEGRIDPRYLRRRTADARQVLYVSEEGGAVDVWQLDVTTRRRQQLTVTDTREGRIEVSADGTLLLYEQIREEAHLAVLDPAQKNPVVTKLTSDSLSDLLPDASDSGRDMVFQRSTMLDMALGMSRATIRLSRDALSGPSERLSDGYAPEISPDGRWVAYSVWKPDALAELWIIDVLNRRPMLASATFLRFAYTPFPLDRSSANLRWSSQGPRLFFLARGSSGSPDIWRATPISDGQALEVTQITHIGDDTAEVTDVQVAADGNQLSYLLRSKARARSELHVFNLARKEDSVPFGEVAEFVLGSPGWTTDGSVVVLRSDAGQSLTDVLLVKDGRTRKVGLLRDQRRGTIALDPRLRLLYFGRPQENRHSLFSCSLDTGQLRRVFQGEPNGPAFSGLRVLGNGQLLFSFQAQNRDIMSSVLGK